jgi:hypothetical protein
VSAAMDDPLGYLYRTAMNLFRKGYRRAMDPHQEAHRAARAVASVRSVGPRGVRPGREDLSRARSRLSAPLRAALHPPSGQAICARSCICGSHQKERELLGQQFAYMGGRVERVRLETLQQPLDPTDPRGEALTPSPIGHLLVAFPRPETDEP